MYDFSSMNPGGKIGAKREKQQWDYAMSPENYHRFLNAIRETPGNKRYAERDYILFVIMGNLGLRVGEAAILKADDFKPLSRKIPSAIVTVLKKRDKKNAKIKKRYTKTIYVHKKIAEMINGYIKNNVLENDKYLFPGSSRSGSVSKKLKGEEGYLSTRQISRYFINYCRSAGLTENYSTHSLRHMYGSVAYQKTKDLAFVRDQLGHSSVEGGGATDIYVNMFESVIEERVKQVGYIL